MALMIVWLKWLALGTGLLRVRSHEFEQFAYRAMSDARSPPGGDQSFGSCGPGEGVLGSSPAAVEEVEEEREQAAGEDDGPQMEQKTCQCP